jgi:glutamyl-tRNA reductase
MPLVSFGVNHKTASLKTRECLVFDQERACSALSYLIDLSLIQEGFILSTCNRTELYVSSDSPQVLLSWLRQHLAEYSFDISSAGYVHRHDEVVKHLLRVSVGLESMVLGESQILGQLKDAYFRAEKAGVAGAYFKRLMPSIFSIAKRIRSSTDVGKNSVTITSAVLQLVRQNFSDLSSLRVLLIGVGEMTRSVAAYLQKYTKQLVVANRTLENAQKFCQHINAEAVALADVSRVLPCVDVVVSATSCPEFVITQSQMRESLSLSEQKRRLLVDLAVPRDIDPAVTSLFSVELFDMDAIEHLVSMNLGLRLSSVQKAEQIIEEEVRHLCDSQRVAQLGGVISRFRGKYESIRDRAVADALAALHKGKDPADVIVEMGRSLMNKTLHEPTLSLRQAAYRDNRKAVSFVKELFNLL